MVSKSFTEEILDSEGLQKYGQDRYRLRDFEAALHAFSNALDAEIVHDRIGLLDNRAAVYSALSDNKAALKDARLMIKLDKTDPRGHLRAGKVLQVMKQYDVALNIYLYGLKNVPPKSNGRKILSSLCEKLQKLRFPTDAKDPLAVFPLEIIEIILGQMNFSQRVAMMRVSKKWNGLLRSLPRCWKDLDLVHAARRKVPVREAALRSYIRNANDRIRSAKLYGIPSKNAMQIATLVCKCHVEHLELHSELRGVNLFEAFRFAEKLQVLKTNSTVDVTFDTIVDILKTCRSLRKLEILHMSGGPLPLPLAVSKYPVIGNEPWANLESLIIESLPVNVPGLPVDGLLHKVVSVMTNLEELRLRNCYIPESLVGVQDLPHLRILDLTNSYPSVMPQLPQSIEQLIMSNCRNIHRTTSTYQFSGRLPNLHTVNLEGANGTPFGFLADLFQQARPPLKSLNISNIIAWTEEEIKACMLENDWSQITELHVAGASYMTDRILPSLLASVPALRVLDATGTKITGVVVKGLLDKEQKIEKLILLECREVSPDAVEYARSVGVKVYMGFPSRR